MSFKNNIFANYVAQIYLTLIGIIVLPYYVDLLGPEAYGLVAFFTSLQTIFYLLDLGLSQTVARDTSRLRVGKLSSREFAHFIKTVNLIFISVGLIGCTAFLLSINFLTYEWFSFQKLTSAEVSQSLYYMIGGVLFRWLSSPYRGIVLGSEGHIWLSSINIFVASLRFLGVLPLMIYWSDSPTTFFAYQFVIAFLELVLMYSKATQFISQRVSLRDLDFSPIKKSLKFSLSMALTSSLWILVTQMDKLFLSGLLKLAEYGYFSLAAVVANGVIALGGPISTVLMPRLTSLEAQSDKKSLLEIYKKATQVLSIIGGGAVVVLALHSELFLFVWTGKEEIVRKTGSILRVYVSGNLFYMFNLFPSYIQYAKGNMKYHLIGNIIFVTLLIPMILIIAPVSGGLGAGYVWLGLNLCYFLLWTSFSHSKLIKGKHFNWVLSDILRIIVPIFLLNIIFQKVFIDILVLTTGRIEGFIYLIVVSVLSLVLGAFVTPVGRHYLGDKMSEIGIK